MPKKRVNFTLDVMSIETLNRLVQKGIYDSHSQAVRKLLGKEARELGVWIGNSSVRAAKNVPYTI